MKRYAIFVGNVYYPLGGMKDFHSSYDSLEDALAALKGPIFPDGYTDGEPNVWEKAQSSWWHIADMLAEPAPTIIKRSPSIRDKEELGRDEYHKQAVEL